MAKKQLVITELYAWVTVDDGDGSEGVLGVMGMPMIGADRERIESYREYAVAMAAYHPHPIQLRKFSNMTIMEVIDGQGTAQGTEASEYAAGKVAADGQQDDARTAPGVQDAGIDEPA